MSDTEPGRLGWLIVAMLFTFMLLNFASKVVLGLAAARLSAARSPCRCRSINRSSVNFCSSAVRLFFSASRADQKRSVTRPDCSGPRHWCCDWFAFRLDRCGRRHLPESRAAHHALGQDEGNFRRRRSFHSGELNCRFVGPCLVFGAGAARDNLLGAGGNHRRLDWNYFGMSSAGNSRSAMAVRGAGFSWSEIVVGSYGSLAPQ